MNGKKAKDLGEIRRTLLLFKTGNDGPEMEMM